MTISVKGENLDPKSQVKVDDETLRADMYWILGTPDAQSGFCSDMSISLNAATKYLDGKHTLTLVNTDGQGATQNFPVDPMTIDRVEGLTEGSPINAKVTGSNFSSGTTAEWRNPPDGTLTQLTVDAASVKPTELVITGPIPGKPGTGKLTLISPIRLRTGAAVSVARMIDSIADLTAGNNPVPVTIKGRNFVQGTTFEWRNPANTANATEQGPATHVSATEVTVTLTPGAAGSAKLTLRLPNNVQASADVTVK